MIHGLAIWHYPHRSIADNIRYFAARGFASVSAHGAQLVRALAEDSVSEEIAAAARETGVVLTVHYALPKNHAEDTVAEYRRGISVLAAWQRDYGLISVLSFDVPQGIRDDVYGYIRLALEQVSDCRIAVEDFGLSAAERDQLVFLRDEPRFGYLVDIGHLFLRIRGQNRSGKALFTNAPDEHLPVLCPDHADFAAALSSKELPVWEIHLHTNNGTDDLHWFLEEGEMDVAAVARALREWGFEGILTLESAPGFRFACHGTDADEGILRTFAYWQSLQGLG